MTGAILPLLHDSNDTSCTAELLIVIPDVTENPEVIEGRAGLKSLHSATLGEDFFKVYVK
jgi:hypothetical protein